MDGIGKLLDELRKEWPVITQAPVLFGTVTVAIIGSIWAIFQQMYKTTIERKNELIKTLQDQLSNIPVTQVVSPPPPADPPNFAIQIDGGNVFIPDQMPDLTGIALEVLIINSGSPSIARDWQLSVAPLSGAPKTAQITRIPKSLTLAGGGNTVPLTEADSLVESCLDHLLEAGKPRRGTILFYIALPKSNVMQSVFELTVKDAKGNLFQARRDMNDWMTR